MPVPLVHVWQWFGELSRGRTCGMATNPITWSDLDAWARLTGVRPTPLELELIYALDEALFSTLRDKAT